MAKDGIAEKDTSPTYDPLLEGVRGLAILLVLAHHLVLFNGAALTTSFAKCFFALAYSGWIGVDLFLVLSGFLITSRLMQTRGKPHYFRNFYARRALRILPLYVLFLAVFWGTAPFLGWESARLDAATRDQFWYWSLLYNVRMGFTGWSPSPISHFWSLALQVQFYVVWPFFVLWLDRRRLFQVCCALVVLAFLSRLFFIENNMVVAAYTFLSSRMDALALGAVLALVSEGVLLRFRAGLRFVFLLGCCGLAALCVRQRGLYDTMPATLLFGLTCTALVFAVVLARAVYIRPLLLTRALSHPVLRWCGTYSYGVYMVHLPVIILCNQIIAGQLQELSFFPRLAVLGIFSILLTLLLAVGSRQLIELPFLKLKRYF